LEGFLRVFTNVLWQDGWQVGQQGLAEPATVGVMLGFRIGARICLRKGSEGGMAMAVYCRNCGRSLADDARFCAGCGASMPPVAPPYYPTTTVTRLVRPRMGRMIAGVCQGLANAYAWDVVWVRVITVLLTVFGGGSGLLAYIIFWIVMPEEPLLLPPVIPPVAPPQPPYPPSS
jgi:phage shock protein C